MPYTSSDAPDYIPKSKKAQWAAIWNRVYDENIKAGKSKDDAESDAFKKATGTINNSRAASELVQIEPAHGVERWALSFVGGKDTGNQPKSCFVCPFFYINQKRCQIHGPDIIIDRVMKDGKQWTPVCTYQKGGAPLAVEDSRVVYNVNRLGKDAAEDTGLEWALGPGTNCGGFADGAPCEHFVVTDGKGVDGACELMKADDNKVDWDDCCNGHEGEHIGWEEAQKLLLETRMRGLLNEIRNKG